MALGLGLITALGLVALGSAGQSEARDQDEAKLYATAPQLPALISAFDRAQEEADQIPSKARFQQQLALDELAGEDRGLSRRLTGSRGDVAYVWPMEEGVCHQSAFTSGCSPTSLLADRGVLIGSAFGSETKDVHVFGVVKDGIDSVTFALKDGRSVTVEVNENSVQLDGQVDPVEARWMNPDGSAGVQSGLVPRPGQ